MERNPVSDCIPFHRCSVWEGRESFSYLFLSNKAMYEINRNRRLPLISYISVFSLLRVSSVAGGEIMVVAGCL